MAREVVLVARSTTTVGLATLAAVHVEDEAVTTYVYDPAATSVSVHDSGEAGSRPVGELPHASSDEPEGWAVRVTK